MSKPPLAALFGAFVWLVNFMTRFMLLELALEGESLLTSFTFELTILMFVRCNFNAPCVTKNLLHLLHCNGRCFSLKCWFRALTLLQCLLHFMHLKECNFFLDVSCFLGVCVPFPFFLSTKLLVNILWPCTSPFLLEELKHWFFLGV